MGFLDDLFDGNFDMSFLVRNQIEHMDLPEAFFEHPKDMITAMLIKKEEFIAALYNADSPDTYKAEQFRMKPLSTGKMLYVVIMPPAPEFPLNCSFIALGADKDGNNPVYYTIEKREDGGFYLCVRHDMDVHAILAVECGETPKENLQALYDTLLGKNE